MFALKDNSTAAAEQRQCTCTDVVYEEEIEREEVSRSEL